MKSGDLGDVEYFSSASSIRTAGESFFSRELLLRPSAKLKLFASGKMDTTTVQSITEKSFA